MKKPIGVGIIGCGMISVNHFSALKSLTDANLVAVCDIDENALTKAQNEQNVQGFLTYQEMLAQPWVDAVHICTPHDTHAQIAIDALGAGKHVLCEKPMATSLEDAKKMAEASAQSGKQLGVCFQNRYNAGSQKIREVLDSGAMGEVLGGRVVVTWNRGETYYEGSPWKGRWRTEGGGVLINQAIHAFDLLRWLSGKVVDLKSSLSTKRLDEMIEVEDTCDILLTLKNGGRLLFYASNCYVSNAPIQMELQCEKGMISMLGSCVTLRTEAGQECFDYTTTVKCGKDYWGSGHGPLIEDFYRSVVSGEAFAINALEALQTTTLIEKVYEPYREKRG